MTPLLLGRVGFKPSRQPPPRPKILFNEAEGNWKRGLLINARWGGTGDHWQNLSMMTHNMNTKPYNTVERHLDGLMLSFKNFEDLKRNDKYLDYWYGVHIWVQTLIAPWADQPAPSHELRS